MATRKSDGFSLIETVAALVILSMSLMAIMELYSTSLRTVRKAEDQSRGLLYARSLMDEAYASADIENLDVHFTYGDFSAERTVEEMPTEKGYEQVSVYEILVTVSWDPSGQTVLRGLRSVRNEME